MAEDTVIIPAITPTRVRPKCTSVTEDPSFPIDIDVLGYKGNQGHHNSGGYASGRNGHLNKVIPNTQLFKKEKEEREMGIQN